MKPYSKLFIAFLLTALSAFATEELMTVRDVRNDNWEVRCNIAPGTSQVTFAVVNDANLATVRTDCSAEALPDDAFCLKIPRDGGHYHAHIRKKRLLLNAETLLLRHNAHHFELMADGLLLARVFAPNSFKGKLMASSAADSEPAIRNAKYQRLEPIVFGDDFMRTEEEAKSLGQWTPVSGDWKIYSVMERIHANPAARIRPGKIPVPDRSPNPFTLSGKSKPDEDAVILTGQKYWNAYRAEATVKPAIGAPCGIIFSCRDANNFWYCKWRPDSYGTSPIRFQLIQRSGGHDLVRQETTIKARANSFTRIAVETTGQDIRVFIDGVQILDFLSDSCTGGQIGLFASGTAETHFDDIAVTSITTLTPRTSYALRELACLNYSLDHHDSSGRDFEFSRNKTGDILALRPIKKMASISFGDMTWKPQRFETDIRPLRQDKSDFSNAGAMFAKDSLKALLNQNGNLLTLKLLNAEDGRQLQAITLKRMNPEYPVRLAIDERVKGITEIWLDNTLACRHADANRPQGGKITILAENADATFENPVFFADFKRNWEKPVDIERFANDPYMQGWASSRYVWLRTKEPNVFPQTFTFTGDIYGAFSLKSPLVNGLDYTFGNDDLTSRDVYRLNTDINEKDAAADITLLKGGKKLFTARLNGLKHEIRQGTQIVDEKIGARPKTPDTLCWGDVTFHRDGFALWLEFNGRCIASTLDPEPLTGRALAADVPAPLDFIHIDVRREQVLDYLFEKAEADFSTLGRWEVTNRFACDPRWSHLNGESFGTAALTSKFDVQGDFTVECFAGMRMRQGELKEEAAMNYPRVGDINLALQTSENSLFDGYNLIIQAWDEKWSESQTRFMRKDAVMATSTEQLIPGGRFRAPKTRNIPQDWDPGGRPVHGAWFALKIRRTGTVFDVWLDNKHVFNVKDSDPLKALGRIALWTQHNSIVLARVKVNYQALHRESPVTTQTESRLERFRKTPMTVSQDSAVLHGAKATPLLPISAPNTDQSAESTCLGWNGNNQAFLLQNVNAGGDFGTRFTLKPDNALLNAISLEFDCAISKDARLNLYIDPKDPNLPRLFIPITGPQQDGTDLKRIGLPKITVIKPNALDGRDWVHVAIPLAAAFRQAFPFHDASDDAEDIILGMLHEGYLNAGLGGNPRDAWYVLANPAAYSLDTSAHLADAEQPRLAPLSPEDAKPWPLDDIRLKCRGLTALAPCLQNATLTVNGQSMTLTQQNASLLDGVIRITPDPKAMRIALKDKAHVQFSFAWKHPLTNADEKLEWTATADFTADKTPPTPPEITGCNTLFTSPGHWKRDCAGLKTNPRTAFDYTTTSDGRPAIRATARICGSPLSLPLFACKTEDIARYPRIIFDLKIDSSTFIDVKATSTSSNCNFLLSDRENSNVEFAEVEGFKPDGQWHTVMADLYGNIYEHGGPLPCTPVQLKNITFQNFGYCGTFPGASYELSNIRFATAATTRAPLVLRWESHDLAGISKCAVKWSRELNDEPEDIQDAAEHSITAPELPDGLNVLHIRTCDTNGNWSATTHQPFFIDNAEPAVASQNCSAGEPAVPDTLEAMLSDRTLGLNASKIACSVNGEDIRLRPADLIYDRKKRALSLNIMRLADIFSCRLPDRTPVRVDLANLTNAVGTPIPAIRWSWLVDYAKDTRPPEAPAVTMHHPAFLQYRQNDPVRLAQRGRTRWTTVTSLQDELIKAPCLDCVTQKATAGRCMLPLHPSAFGKDARLIMFDIRLYPGTRANLAIYTGMKKNVFRLNGPVDDNAIAKIDGITDDAQWHTVTLNLKTELRNAQSAIARKLPITGASLEFAPQDNAKTHARIANVHVVNALPPVLQLSLTANDATGIDELCAAVTKASQQTELPPLPDYIAQQHAVWYKVVDAPGIHFIHAAAKDGAGNVSRTATIPFICENPVTPVQNDDTLDNFSKHSWSVRPILPKDRHSRLPVLHCLDSEQKNAKILTLKFRDQTKGCLLVTPADDHLILGEALNVICDVLLPDDGENLDLSLVALDRQGDIIAESESFRLTGGNAWKRRLPFSCNMKAGKTQTNDMQKKKVKFLGFKCTTPKRSKGLLLLDNLILK